MIWIFFLVGMLLTLFCLGCLYVAWDSSSWPTVRGKVLHSCLAERTANGHTSYRPMLVYEYFVDGVTRRSATIGFFAGIEGEEWGRRLLEGRDEGADVRVYYHPLVNRLAVLDPGVKQAWVWLLLAVVGAVFSVSSGVVLFADDRDIFRDTIFHGVSLLIS